LTFEVDVCANLGKFGVNFGAIYVQNLGKILRLDVGMSHNPGESFGAGLNMSEISSGPYKRGCLK
jgi:hypothetical protein